MTFQVSFFSIFFHQKKLKFYQTRGSFSSFSFTLKQKWLSVSILFAISPHCERPKIFLLQPWTYWRWGETNKIIKNQLMFLQMEKNRTKFNLTTCHFYQSRKPIKTDILRVFLEKIPFILNAVDILRHFFPSWCLSERGVVKQIFIANQLSQLRLVLFNWAKKKTKSPFSFDFSILLKQKGKIF